MKLFYKKSTFYLLLTGTAIMMIVMFCSGHLLNTTQTPRGIICLELANTHQKVQHTLAAWKSSSTSGADLIAIAKNNTGLDFIFLFFYALFLFTCCIHLAQSLPNKKIFSKTSYVMAACALAAGILDIFENIGMLKSLNGNGSEWIAAATAFVSYIKWSLVFLVILFIAAGLIYQNIFRKKQASKIDSAFAQKHP